MQELNKYNELGRPLTTEEVDGNWDSIAAAIASLENGGIQIVGINLLENEAGAFLQFLNASGGSIAEIPFPAGLQTAGEWISGASYTTRDIVTFDGGTFLCSVAHVASGADIWDDLDLGRWVQLGSSGAVSIDFRAMGSGMVSDTVQDAILELFGLISSISVTATSVSYDNTASGIEATSVQDAIDEIVQVVASIQDGGGSGGGSGTDDQTAAEVSFTPVSGTSATNVQAALADAFEAIGDLQEAGVGGTDDQTAAEVSFSNSEFFATNVQAALVELKNSIPSGGGGGTVDASGVSINDTGWTQIGGENVQDALWGADFQLRVLQQLLDALPSNRVMHGETRLDILLGEILTRLQSLENA